MKLSEAGKYLPLVKAAAEGKTIQYCKKEWGRWVDCAPHSRVWFDGTVEYRIKPERTLRPWKPEEVPVGCLLRDEWGKAVLTHTEGIGDMLCICAPDTSSTEPWRKWYVVQAHDIPSLMHSLDGGKTWKPCGVEDAQ